MKNFELYQKEISDFLLSHGQNAAFVKNWVDYLFAEHSKVPVLNCAELAFCKALQSGWIARDANGTVKFFAEKPHKTEDGRWKIACEQQIQLVNVSILQMVNPELQFHFVHWTDDIPWSVIDLLQQYKVNYPDLRLTP